MTGLIGKQLNKRETKRLTAPVTAESELPVDEVRAILKDLEREQVAAIEAKVEASQQRKSKAGRHFFGMSERTQRAHLYVTVHGDEFRVSYPYSDQESSPRSDGKWVACVKVLPRDGGGSLVFVQLMSWISKQAEMDNKKAFKDFMAELGRRIGGTVEP